MLLLLLCCYGRYYRVFVCRSWAADNPAHFKALYGIARSNQLYLLIYMALVLLFVGLLLTRDTVFSIWSIQASTQLHNRECMLGAQHCGCQVAGASHWPSSAPCSSQQMAQL